MTILHRSRNDKFHRADCRYADPSLPWIWAEGKTREQVCDTAELNGIAPCKVCEPRLALPSVFTHAPCCSAHGIDMGCERYRRTHFVEVGNCCAADAAARPEAVDR